MKPTELKIIIEDDKCDVYLNGQTSDIVNCICASIKALSVRLSDKEEYEKYMEIMDLTKQDLQEYLMAIIVANIVDNLEVITDEAEIIEDKGSDDTDSSDEQLDFSKLETLITKNRKDTNT